MAKSLASHISSKGRSQSGAIKIGASANSFLGRDGGVWIIIEKMNQEVNIPHLPIVIVRFNNFRVKLGSSSRTRKASTSKEENNYTRGCEVEENE
ncbi:hypothetical protein Tco_0127279 [Tanacetum coccineum]